MEDNHNFPPYLAFGTLNEESIRNRGEWTLAEYMLDNEKVLEVGYS